MAEEVGDIGGMGVAVQIATAGQPVREFGVRGLVAEARVLSLSSEGVSRGMLRELLVAGRAAGMARPRLCESLRTIHGILRPRAAHGRLKPHDR